ncbi:uncharacterized protein LOC124490619 [Dermatophagoides farinae]|uniref:uncharacterized protein LOC124490619 n=1 Tax=Dermatophagoides farinae TaxID=6954 RepID=UPI003F637910
MKNQTKRILVTPINAVGHVNACTGVALPLLRRGHRVAFFVETPYSGKLKSYGFEEFLFEPFKEPGENVEEFKNPGEQMAKKLLKIGMLGTNDPRIQLAKIDEKKMMSEDKRKYEDEQLRTVIEKFQPDLFIVDNIMLEPAIYYSTKPWIRVISVVPLLHLHDIHELPPAWSGFTDAEYSEWDDIRKYTKKFHYNETFNDINENIGYKRYPDNVMIPETQSLTLYAFPEEYDYPEIKKYRENWFNLDVFNKNEQQEQIDLKEFLPKEFYDNNLDGNFTGKWIYVSMGSMGSVDLNLMHRLIEVLSKTNHKYIVSKGPRHEEYQLKRNLWGDRYLPQTKILPIVDLVITHGGNNSVTETFAQGKPMIIMPLFCDQLDNAQRLSEKKLAIKIQPYNFTDEQLIESIDRLIYDDELNSRLKRASQRILSIDKHEIACDLIEKILQN